MELGSPLPSVVEAWVAALQRRDVLDWGGIALRITGVSIVDPPAFGCGRARMRTETPVVMKSPPSNQLPGQTWVLPAEPEFPTLFNNNLVRKAKTLGLAPDIGLDGIVWVGPKRSFAVKGGAKPGATVDVALSGDPQVLQALWSWGLGQANAAGFGWIGAAQ
ncbi:CRISPR-associated endoribonuclease Cas6 [Dactylosporangium sp. NPDC005555]|uniref:CRISPR-associated endoribonuclease Cas6 n=1 Tax=Dactylosporangium sp. NPDC005555 TaxID=3154889 RepID=UPI0033A788D0